MVYKHAYLNTLLLLHSTFMLSLVKMPLKGDVGGHALNSNGNYIIDRGKSWKNHGITFFNFCGKLLYACGIGTIITWAKFQIFQDPEKTPAPVGFQPFSSSHADEERDEREERGVSYYTVKQLPLNVPIATKVVCFSHLLKCLRSLYGKQCGPRSDCSYRSVLGPRCLLLYLIHQ